MRVKEKINNQKSEENIIKKGENMSTNISTNPTKTFKNLIKANIGCSAGILTMIIGFIVFAFGADFLLNTAMIFYFTELCLAIALVILISIELAIAGNVTGLQPQPFRIGFGIMLGAHTLFLILAPIYNAASFFQLISTLCILVFSCIYTRKLK